MEVASASILDSLEASAELLRSRLGVDTLSVSCFRWRAGDLRTLVNTGLLGPGEQRRPPAECYPLQAFPAAAALVRHRRPYVSTPGAPGDPASLTLEARLEKTSQAAAPVVIEEQVWGELWVASTDAGLPLTRGELPLICWAAANLGRVVADLLAEGIEFDAAAVEHGAAARQYEVWIEGHISALLAALIAAQARRDQHYTVFEAALDQTDLYALLARLNQLALSLVAVRPAQPATTPPERIASRSHRERTYQVQLAGHIDAERLRTDLDCTIHSHSGHAVLTARLDRTGLASLLQRLERIGAELLSVHRTR